MKYKVTLNGKTYEVEVEHGEAIIAAEYAAIAPSPKHTAVEAPSVKPAEKQTQKEASGSQTSGETVKAPIPGTVLKILATVGKDVKKGEVIMILEAMKMENEILAPDSGNLSAIMVSKGASVQTGESLFTIS
jgi:glutaconyl-CoA decarboxylase